MTQEIASGIGQAKLEIIPECGHLATLDQPEAVCELLLDWIKDNKF